MTFRIGQKVVCIADQWSRRAERRLQEYPVKGRVYTVRGLEHINYGSGLGLLLEEIVNPPRSWPDEADGEPGFMSTRFRPVVTRKTSISIFTEMLMPSPARSREFCGND